MLMFDVFCLGVALTVGQGGPTSPLPETPSALPGRALVGDAPPSRLPPPLPTVTLPPPPIPVPLFAVGQAKDAPAEPAPKAEEPKKENGEKKDEEKKDEEKKDEEKKDERGCFMKMLDGTDLGCCLKQKKISISGWIEASYTYSKADFTNMPVVWNDRPNQLIMNQWWLRIASPIDTESKCPSYGFNIDFMYGPDYGDILQAGDG